MSSTSIIDGMSDALVPNMGVTSNSTATRDTPEHPRVSDALARATLYALLESEAIGVALLRSGDWMHVMSSATYDALIGGGPALGRHASAVLPDALISHVGLEDVVSTGRTADVPEVLLRTDTVDGLPVRTYVSFTFLRVRQVTSSADGVLILARDVSKQVHDRRMAELFVLVASDMTAERDEAATIRASVVHASKALGAEAASIFLLSSDGKCLHGALVGWDWTRTSFVVELEHWPNVGRAIATNRTFYVTAAEAQGAEEVWFERRGIKAAVCAPMAAHGRVVGVLFFDYPDLSGAKVDLEMAKDVADQCALLVERAAAHTARF